ncbi:hypothetical protein WMW72_01540 [Paenibacillus filicis]|uniref:Uncharacterized protein n=1 Tax=Paenibacillus filicis TaxID=669464 RepID=A0ABU9DEX2_9BACL
MIWFILLTAAAIGSCVAIMIRQRKKTREITLFVCIALLGTADWISIFLDHKFKSSKVIARLLDLVGL